MALYPSDRPSIEDRVRAATWFANRGFGVFPVWSTKPDGTCRCPKGAECGNAGKHPIPINGFKDATTDLDRIAVFLSAASEPNYGLVPPDDMFILDVDGDDIAKFADLEERLGPLPPTFRTRTANGWHIYMRWPESLPRPQGKLFGFVVRWKDSGYVIGPRSVHATGAVYQPNGVFDFVELPANWGAPTTRRGGGDNPTIKIGGELPGVGGRHDWLRDRARYYRGLIDDPNVLRATVLAENARLEAPKTEEEVDRAIGEVYTRFPLDPPAAVEEKIARRLGEEEIGLLGPSAIGEFPAAPNEAAFGGLLGEMTMQIAPGTDASLAGILGSLIAFCGALIPGQAYFHRSQTSSPFVALVGESSIGRKGTAMLRAHNAMTTGIDPTYVNRVVLDGLNSGEGLVNALHYRQEQFKYEPTVGLVFEEEFASLLASRGREGSTLDAKMRAGFDGSVMSNRRSKDTQSVNPPYWLPALIAITPVELKQRLEAGALQTGSANRWLYLPVVKRDVVPENTTPEFSQEVKDALMSARRWAVDKFRVAHVEPGVTAVLTDYADFLPTVSHGVSLDLTRRFSVIAFRVALVHAMVERSEWVTVEHLERAMALTEYARAGLPWVFGETIGNKDADRLHRALTRYGRLTKSQITQHVVRDQQRQQDAIDELIRLGLAAIDTIDTSGRPRTELVPGEAFLAFVQYPRIPHQQNRQNLHGMHVSAQTTAQKPHESRTEAARNYTEVDEMEEGFRWSKEEDSEPETIVCSNYSEHQTKHFRGPAGWVCPVCTPVH